MKGCQVRSRPRRIHSKIGVGEVRGWVRVRSELIQNMARVDSGFGQG